MLLFEIDSAWFFIEKSKNNVVHIQDHEEQNRTYLKNEKSHLNEMFVEYSMDEYRK